MSPNNWVIRRSLITSLPLYLLVARTIFSVQFHRAPRPSNGCQPIQGVSRGHAAATLPGRPKRRTLWDLGACFTTCSSNGEVSRESSLDRFGRWRGALRRHVGAGIGDAHHQSRRRGERSRARPKRALRVPSLSLPVAAELRLSPAGLLRLWTQLLQLCTKLLRLRTRLVRRLVWRRSLRSLVVVRRPIVSPRLR